MDILGNKVFRSVSGDPALLSSESLSSPSAVIPAAGDRFVVTAGRRLYIADRGFDTIREFSEVPDAEGSNRCNDAKCDPYGNLWVGTMDTGENRRSGRLWCFNGDGDARLMLENVGISNTLAWDLARNRFYFADSMDGDIFVFDYEPAGPAIRNKRVFFSRGEAPGVPDGSAIDSQGYLWNARWDGSCVVRISIDGKVDRRIELPVARPTSCAFGGSDLSTLFVTSASLGHGRSGKKPGLSGAVFSVVTDVRGSAVPEYRMQPDGHVRDRAG
ncbi:MAG: SMP-30/gluconolactonase/LRE family protein [Proteobacteria bacterium]|nr:SMP-30/gluconolactonase/LRE family protein [Pseudomonadota bacterium]